MSTGRSARSRRVSPSEHAGPSCLTCAVLRGKLEMAEGVIRQLMEVAARHPVSGVVTGHGTPPEPPKPEKPLPSKVAQAIVLKFPKRTSERADHETLARDLLASGMQDGDVARMIEDGRQIEI